MRLGLVDTLIPEPLGGAHRDRDVTVAMVGTAIAEALGALASLDAATLKARRREKFLQMGREAIG